MCGFAGFLDSTPTDSRERAARLSRMARAISHRGPDEERLYYDCFVGLAFRRLSIIDLEGGSQPLWNEDRTVVAVVNGEIYNHVDLRRALSGRHRFATHSDAEVVLHLYEDHGDQLVAHLDGMFALALWDLRARRLLLARDPLGIKPLYVAAPPGGPLLFGSELKALLAHPACPAEIDLGGLTVPLSFDADSVPSYMRGVEHLPGGCTLTGEVDRAPHRRRYWALANHLGADDAPPRPAAAYIDGYAERLLASIDAHLMSDVPMGIFLSGGVDSAIVAAVVARRRHDLHCFTVVTDATLANGDVTHAVAVARTLQLPLHAVDLRDGPLLEAIGGGVPARALDWFERLVWALDGPRFDIECVLKHELHRHARAVLPALKVILVGQGADEFAGGYSTPADATLPSWNAYVEGPLRASERARAVAQIGAPAAAFLSDEALDGLASRKAAPVPAPFHREMLWRTAALPFYNLWHEDRTSMQQGVEVRVPFLHRPVVEHLASVPSRLHRELFWEKRIVREVAQRLLPRRFAERPKVRFVLTRGRPLHLDLLARLALALAPAARERYAASGGILDTATFDGLIQLIRAGGAGADSAVESLLRGMAIGAFATMLREIRTDGCAAPRGALPALQHPELPVRAIQELARRGA
ncbi:asparagine synthase (glutamine-hydrolyzing) [Sorangium sp. So ce302]|uniref:asparagine synthase (glutamine-hydrolyzing) n=1 Tax=Sorangium sp. So ce302 TaxID=3133297 RepID=UPI003F5FE3B1